MSPERYLVGDSQGEAAFLATVANAVRSDPEIELLEEKGDPGSPTLLVASMSPERAEALRQQHGARLIVEPDAPVQLS
jgi:hypothetical protein